MKRIRENLKAHELIGLRADVVESRDSGLIGLSGVVVDETRNMLGLKVDGVVKLLAKSVVKLRFHLPDGASCVIDGELLIGRAEDRVARLR